MDEREGDETEPAGEPGPGLERCPGCLRSVGLPGALCPYCGSRYPDPAARATAAGLGAVGAVALAVALALSGLSESVAGLFAVVGVVALLAAGSIAARARGRVGPELPRQASCCGCSCLVALLAVTSLGALLWRHGGPALAAAALPAWIPLSWAIRALELIAAAMPLKATVRERGAGPHGLGLRR